MERAPAGLSNALVMSPRTLITVCLSLGACKDDPPPPPPEQPKLEKGEACDPSVEPLTEEELEMLEPGTEVAPVCAQGLACDPVDGAETYVCGAAFQLEGQVTDSLSGEPIEGALVAALDQTGQPVTDVVATDSCGAYILPIAIRRTAEGEFAEMPQWTLIASAQDYQPFPAGLRPALPVDIVEAVPDEDPPEPPEGEEEDEDEEEQHLAQVVENAATSIALIPLDEEDRGGAIVSGTVGTDADERAGTLVVAEAGERRSPYAIADASGHYTLFNVPSAGVEIRGYRKGLQVEPTMISGGDGEHLEAVDLAVVGGPISTVTGSINIVNAEGGSITSVVLVPAAAYNAALERGPVPLGLREPDPPLPPDVANAFSLEGVPNGTYKVLVAFENDALVRDPDEGIAGTEIQEITVADGRDMAVEESFKVTQALRIVGPGADAPEEVEAKPTFVWADDSSEDGYEVTVFDALGTIVWEVDAPRVTGSENVELEYDGPALEAGMYYQFRVVSFHEDQAERQYISRTEDLRGVFFHGTAPEAEACVVEADTEDAATTSTGE